MKCGNLGGQVLVGIRGEAFFFLSWLDAPRIAILIGTKKEDVQEIHKNYPYHSIFLPLPELWVEIVSSCPISLKVPVGTPCFCAAPACLLADAKTNKNPKKRTHNSGNGRNRTRQRER